MMHYLVSYRKKPGEWQTIASELSSLQATRLRESLEEQGYEVRISTVDKPLQSTVQVQPYEVRVRVAGAGR